MEQGHVPPRGYLERTKATKRARNGIVAIQNRLGSLRGGRPHVDGGADVVGSPVASGPGRDPIASGSSEPGGAHADAEGGISGPPNEPPRSRSTGSRSAKRAMKIEGLQRKLAVLRRSVNDREMSRATGIVSPAKRPRATAGETRPHRDGEPPIHREPASRIAEPLAPDWGRGLWGEPRPLAGSRPLPTFDDPMLNRAADMFRIPGLAHFMAVQMQRQVVFDGFDDVLSGRDRAFDGLSLADAFCDCEIDLCVAQELLGGDTKLASALLEFVAAGPTTARA